MSVNSFMRIFFIDPQSYNNLQRYDYNILSNISQEMDFFGSQYYDYLPLPEYINSHLWFKYNKKSNALLKAVSYVWTCLRIFFFKISWSGMDYRRIYRTSANT